MRILLVGPKSLELSESRFDMIVWNFLLPLKSLGHDVLLHDTILNDPDSFSLKVRDFEPDLIFCIMTGDPKYGQLEPWREIKKITEERDDIITFNWFCDDAWRFDEWSSKVCTHFNACSTTEGYCIEKYRNIGYNNIFEANWHSNRDLYNIESCPKPHDITFIGAPYQDRLRYLNNLAEHSDLHDRVHYPGPCSFERMIHIMNMSKIVLSFAANPNGDNVLQMKGRMFEVPASEALLVTEYTPGLEKFFDNNSEAVFFKTPEELVKKLRKLLEKPDILNVIAKNGYNRYLRDHTSEKRLGDLLEWIKSL